MNKTKLLLAAVFLFLFPFQVFAIPSSVDRITDHIEPLIKTDFIRGAYFNATSTTATSTFANGLNITKGCFSLNGTCITAGGSGTVTSVNASGGSTGLSFSGGPINTSGTLTLDGLLVPLFGGTGSTTLSGILKGNGTGVVRTAVANTDYQIPINLTTTGTSGASTFNGSTLNIPQYTSGGSSSDKWATSTDTTSIFPNSATKVGIATSSPYKTLSVTGDAVITNYLQVGSSTGATQLQNFIGDYVCNLNSYCTLNVANNNAGTVASADFTLNNDITLSSGALVYTDLGMNSSKYTDATYPGFNRPSQFYLYNTEDAISIFAASSTNANAYISLGTGGSGTANERMRITSAGNVGIGLTAPQTALEVNGTASSTRYIAGLGAVGTPTYSFSGDTDTGLYSTSNSVKIAAGGNIAMSFNNNGMTTGFSIVQSNSTRGWSLQVPVTPSVSLPSYTFFGDTNTGLWQQYADALNLTVGGTEVFRSDIASTSIPVGKFGVGTTTPFAKLSVNSTTGIDPLAVATSTTGTLVFGIDQDGHRYSAGPAPLVSACGTGAGTVVGDDQGGTITTATAATACTITFSKAYATTPYCVVTDNSLVVFADVSSISTSAVTFGISSALTGGNLFYQCSYHHL